jgi:hypothetical protein
LRGECEDEKSDKVYWGLTLKWILSRIIRIKENILLIPNRSYGVMILRLYPDLFI